MDFLVAKDFTITAISIQEEKMSSDQQALDTFRADVRPKLKVMGFNSDTLDTISRQIRECLLSTTMAAEYTFCPGYKFFLESKYRYGD